MNRELLNQLAKEKKINLKDYDYYYGQVIGKWLYADFCVRCATHVAQPMRMLTIKMSATALDKRNAMGKSNYISYDYESQGRFLYIPEMK